MNPLVTIIMATYNRAHLIEETLGSIKNQTYTHWECLIIDDGGTDNTLEVIGHYLKNDTRFKYFQRPENHKKGLPGCRNFGLDVANGEYIIFFDDDDIVHPQNLELCLEAIKVNNVDFIVYQKKSFMNSFSETIKREVLSVSDKVITLRDVIMSKTPMASCVVLWSKLCLQEYRFKEDLQFAEEWELFTRIISDKKKGLLINNVLYFNRKHPQSNTGEFWNNEPIRRASKVEAVKLVISNLAKNKLIDYKLAVYFISLAHFLKEGSVFEHLMKYKSLFELSERLKLLLRYYGNFLIKPVYKLKKRFT